MSEWRTIETAPRDGTLILTWDDLCGYQLALYGEYPEPLARDMSATEGWHDGAFPVIGDFGEPTHWTHLPSPPEEA